MELPQNGESSRSPHRVSSPGVHDVSTANGHREANGEAPIEDGMSKLILGNWDIPPPKRIHASHDLISLLHLDGLYNIHVRPYADPLGPEEDGRGDGEGGEGENRTSKKRKRRARLEKSYYHLLDDCMDPTPTGDNKDNLSILPLIPDRLDLNFPQDPPEFGPRPKLLSDDLFANAYLEHGQTVDGYSEGVKKGVREAEADRERKRVARQLRMQAKPPPIESPALPSPRDRSAPPTPGLPVLPPGPPYSNNPLRKPFLPMRPGATPGTPGNLSRTGTTMRIPGTPSGRPGSPMVRPGGVAPGTPGLHRGFSGLPNKPVAHDISTPRPYASGQNTKRPGDPLQHSNIKRSKPGGGSRSASPMPPQTAYHPATQGRPGVGKQPRSKTEG